MKVVSIEDCERTGAARVHGKRKVIGATRFLFSRTSVTRNFVRDQSASCTNVPAPCTFILHRGSRRIKNLVFDLDHEVSRWILDYAHEYGFLIDRDRRFIASHCAYISKIINALSFSPILNQPHYFVHKTKELAPPEATSKKCMKTLKRDLAIVSCHKIPFAMPGIQPLATLSGKLSLFRGVLWSNQSATMGGIKLDKTGAPHR